MNPLINKTSTGWETKDKKYQITGGEQLGKRLPDGTHESKAVYHIRRDGQYVAQAYDLDKDIERAVRDSDDRWKLKELPEKF